MAERENDPNDPKRPDAEQRERERELHRAQLDAVRDAFAAQGEPPPAQPPESGEPDEALRTEYLVARLRSEMRRLDRKQRTTARVAVALALAVLLGAFALLDQMFQRLDRPFAHDEISARSVRADRIVVTRDLRVLDESGKELALFGREPSGSGAGPLGGPVVLAMNSENDPSRQLLRFAASKTGAGLTLEAPAGSSSVSLLSTQSGSTVEVRNGEETQRVAGDSAGRLAPVSAGPPAAQASAASEVPTWTPRREGAPSGALPELREVGHGFLVSGLSAQRVADGVELSGRMVNTSAVVHSGLAFRVTLGDTSTTMTVPKISPGNSTGFRVMLAGASADAASGARVEYLGSTVAFQATSTEPIYGRRVEPN